MVQQQTERLFSLSVKIVQSQQSTVVQIPFMPDTCKHLTARESSALSKPQLKLINATIDSLMEEGAEGCSVRKICARANASTGLINYHFGSLNHLLAAAYQHLALSFLEDAIAATKKFPQQPAKQISAFLTATFSSKVTQANTPRAWLVFWGLIDTVPAIRDAQRSSNLAQIGFLEGLFSQMNSTSISPRLAATGLSAMIDGLWLESCLNSDTIDASECVRLCELWVSGSGQVVVDTFK